MRRSACVRPDQLHLDGIVEFPPKRTRARTGAADRPVSSVKRRKPCCSPLPKARDTTAGDAIERSLTE